MSYYYTFSRNDACGAFKPSPGAIFESRNAVRNFVLLRAPSDPFSALIPEYFGLSVSDYDFAVGAPIKLCCNERGKVDELGS